MGGGEERREQWKGKDERWSKVEEVSGKELKLFLLHVAISSLSVANLRISEFQPFSQSFRFQNRQELMVSALLQN